MIRLFLTVLCVSVLSCKSDKRYHDQKSATAGKAVASGDAYLDGLNRLRAEKDRSFADAVTSPLTADRLKEFKGLLYYPVDTTYRVDAVLEPSVSAGFTLMPTTTEREVQQRVFGVLHFNINGQDLRLNVYQDPELIREPGYENYLFLPFTDQTNGEETYGGGRYIDLSVPEGNHLVIDFNKAYNPYCAYNKKYSCPLVPRENHLEVAIKAGEKY